MLARERLSVGNMFSPAVANLASSLAIARSHAATSWHPAPEATPWTLAMTGWGTFWRAIINREHLRRRSHASVKARPKKPR